MHLSNFLLFSSLDYVNVMAYDYHGTLIKFLIAYINWFLLGKWDTVTGINSPLYKSHTELENHEDWKNAVRNKY